MKVVASAREGAVIFFVQITLLAKKNKKHILMRKYPPNSPRSS